MFTYKHRSSAFTLIELLVVIAIIAILAAILFPVFAQAKEAAKKTQGLSNSKQVTLAILQYMNDFDDTPPLGNLDASVLIDSPSVGTSEWQEATYPYTKNQAIYKVPNDTTTVVRFANYSSACQTAVQTGVTQYSASSFLTNYNISYPTQDSTGAFSRTSPNASAYTAPADFILLMHGQRPAMGGDQFASVRYQANPRDHNGDVCSLWLASYSQYADGAMNHLVNYFQSPDFSTVPHFKSGLIFSFLDGHAKFTALNFASRPDQQLQGSLPWCKHGYANADNPACTQVWGIYDQSQ